VTELNFIFLKEILFEITHFGGPKARKFSGLAGAGAARGADALKWSHFTIFLNIGLK
jgi:hypothetical protein